MSNRAEGFGSGKVILAGEHAVVHGRPALAIGLDLGVTAIAEPAEATTLHVPVWDLELTLADAEGDGDKAQLAQAFRVALSQAKLDLPVRVTADVRLPSGAGLGCSAALGVAVFDALERHKGEPTSRTSLGERTLAWEEVFHGNPSGIDNMTAATGGLLYFVRGEAPEISKPGRALPLVIAHSGERSSTKEVVASVARQLERSPARVNELFDGITSVVRNMKLAAEQGDLKAIGQLMDMNQAMLSALMLSTEALETLCREARNAGAFGAKLTGAGAGGCMIALARNEAHAREVQQALEPHASKTWVALAGG